MSDKKESSEKIRFRKSVAKEMRDARQSYRPKKTQGSMATSLGISSQHLSNVETGKYLPSMDLLFDIAHQTGKEVIILLR